MNLQTPKELFLTSEPRAAAHRKLCLDPAVVEAMHVAFQELCWRLPPSDNPNQSWAANARREGAKELVHIFFSLGDPAKEMKRQTPGRLEDEDAHHAQRTGNSSTAGAKPDGKSD